MSWRKLRQDILHVRPSLPEELAIESLWWSPFLSLIGPGFSKSRATALHWQGLWQIRDTRIDGRFITEEEAVQRFGLLANGARGMASSHHCNRCPVAWTATCSFPTGHCQHLGGMVPREDLRFSPLGFASIKEGLFQNRRICPGVDLPPPRPQFYCPPTVPMPPR